MVDGLVERNLLDRLADIVRSGSFSEVLHPDMNDDAEQVPSSAIASDAFELVLNDSQIFAMVEEITGCRSIGCFIGRVYRFMPGSGHSYSWHSDNVDSRMVGMSLNLSEQRFDGGQLEIRDRGNPGSVAVVQNLRFGRAVLFPIGERFEHRVTPVTGNIPRTAFAGWFCAEPQFSERISRIE